MNSEIILYQLENSFSLEVMMENETVWLTQAQMAQLFQKERSVITKHINNIYKEGELNRQITCAKFAHMGLDKDQKYETTMYNLDVIISVGYRVKSKRGTQFRIWATNILKDYLLKGYAINQRLERVEKKLYEHDEKFDLIIKTSLPPKEGLFFEGQIYDAFHFVSDLIKSAKESIILIDNYVDDSVITMMSDKQSNVSVDIYTKNLTKSLILSQEKFNSQYKNLTIKEFSFSHDRFLIIDKKAIYLIGASMKDLGKKWFAFSRLDDINTEEILRRLPKK
jgi:hypothetical protein